MGGNGYSYDDTQSWVRYKDIEDWNKDFLHSTLGKLWDSVKKGGYVLINISDVYSNAKWSTDRGWLEICNPMNDYLSKLGEYQGCIGMEMENDLIVVELEQRKVTKVPFGRRSHLKTKKIRNLENLFGYGKNNRLL